MARFRLAVTLLFVSAVMISQPRSGEDGVTGVQSIDIGPVGPGSFKSVFDDPNTAGLGSGSVNLYTGQHSQSFPLASLSGRGGLGVTLSLDYNGNVAIQAKGENRRAQASPFGLGFSIGLQSIIVNHRGTSSLRDDTYRLIIGSTSMELKNTSSGNSFITDDGQPWKVLRNVSTVANRDCVTGWSIIKEDGTIFEFGDFSNSITGWNATRNILRYGEFVGEGVTNDDTAYACTSSDKSDILV